MKSKEIRVLVTGARGLLGQYLIKVLKESQLVFFAFGKDTLDITDLDSVQSIIDPLKITHIINCAGYTNVSKAEIDRDTCFMVNVVGVNNLVEISNKMHIELVQISTDYVFDGMSKEGVYYPESEKNPLNYYGLTKSMAEDYIIHNALSWKIIRTSWLFGAAPNNFVNKIIRYSSQNRPISINDVEIGVPTYGMDLARAILIVLSLNSGIYQITNSGSASRYQYAKHVLDLTTKSEIFVNNLITDSVIRPKKVILFNNTEFEMRDWREAINAYLDSEC